MSDREEFRSRVLELVESLEGVLNGLEIREVQHLIDHNEIGEALRSLAWIIVDENKRITAETLASIRELSEGLVAEEHMPPGLGLHVER
jgi:hypothetical protein